MGGAYQYRDVISRFKTMGRKHNLISAQKLGETMHFSEIIKLHFEMKKKMPYISVYFTAFLNKCCSIISKKCVFTPHFLFGFQ